MAQPCGHPSAGVCLGVVSCGDVWIVCCLRGVLPNTLNTVCLPYCVYTHTWLAAGLQFAGFATLTTS
jgi:hypothetical protein